MNKWFVDVMIKGRHGELKCIWKSAYRNSYDVAKEMLAVRPQDFISLCSLDMERNILVKSEVIEYLEIYPFEEE